MRRTLFSPGRLVARRFSSHSSSAWVNQMISETQALAGPARVHVCDGSDAEAQTLIDVSLAREKREQRKNPLT